MKKPEAIKRVERAIRTLKKGGMIILLDHLDRENEGDLIVSAEHITTKQMNFMIRQGSGIVCLPMEESALKRLQLPLMLAPVNNTSRYGTPFTVSIDARQGITTGVSAHDRVQTIRVVLNEKSVPSDLVRPGHVFPLQANANGVLERPGHTEGAVDLMRLAGLKPIAVLTEVMNQDGTMAKATQLKRFSTHYRLPMITIEEIILYRLRTENMIQEQTEANIVLSQYGRFKMIALKEKIHHTQHAVLFKKPLHAKKPLLVRIHSSCLTGDLFVSTRCDCHQQLHYALKQIAQFGGMLIYLNQEGRGIGLFNKIKAYALQETGLDTVQANLALGLPVDSRQYYLAAHILKSMKITQVRLLTNNPEKIAALKQYGMQQVKPVVMPAFHHQHNYDYLKTKKNKLQHTIPLKPLQDIADAYSSIQDT